MFSKVIDSELLLADIIGLPSDLANKKVIHFLDTHCREYISKSPFVLLSTSAKDGSCDVSPRGDQPGFVLSLNDKYLVIPDRPGNKRADSLKNILSNPHVGLLFVIPGLKETLRVNGRAQIIQDDEILEQLKANNKKPLLGIAVEVEECYIQCGKALLRSNLWNSQFWLSKDKLPSAGKILAAHADIPGMDEKEMKDRLEDGYVNRMY